MACDIIELSCAELWDHVCKRLVAAVRAFLDSARCSAAERFARSSREWLMPEEEPGNELLCRQALQQTKGNARSLSLDTWLTSHN